MIKSMVSAVLLGFASAQVNPKFCATFDASTAGGASGYYGIEIVNNTAYHNFVLVLEGSSTTCDLNMGLSFDIYSTWTDSSAKSRDASQCTSSNIGGRYDPGLACSSDSNEASGACTTLGRTASTFDYTCSKSVMNLKNYGFCEVGDLSGKFGMVYPTSTDSKVFVQKDLLVDYHPVHEKTYYNTVGYAKTWRSIVFKCFGGDALTCAKFEPFDSLVHACEYPSLEPPEETDDSLTPYWKNTVKNNNNAAISIIVIGVGLVAIIYAVLYHQDQKNKKIEEEARAKRAAEDEKAFNAEIAAPPAH